MQRSTGRNTRSRGAARTLAAGTTNDVDNAGFWLAQTEAAIRAFLHAALDGRGATDLYRWSPDPLAASEAVTLLHTHHQAAPG